MSEATVRQLKVTELRAELQERGLPTSGKKDELIARLLKVLKVAIGGNVQNSNPPVTPTTTTSTSTSNSTSGMQATLVMRNKQSSAASFEDNKLALRATRFNLEPPEAERLKRRRERFNSTSEDLFDPEKLLARQARFGVVISKKLFKHEQETLKTKRLQRFGLNI